MLVWNNIILTITLAFLIWYAIETHKIAAQAKESNLRPVVLRSGYIIWNNIEYTLENNSLEGIPLEFTIRKNIATSINGYIIKNGFYYKLLFGNDISTINNITRLNESWGWMGPDTKIYAFFRNDDKKQSKKPNQIVINYQDIEGNSYYTIEDENFSQKSFKGNLKA